MRCKKTRVYTSKQERQYSSKEKERAETAMQMERRRKQKRLFFLLRKQKGEWPQKVEALHLLWKKKEKQTNKKEKRRTRSK